jgi:hypothetical protein
MLPARLRLLYAQIPKIDWPQSVNVWQLGVFRLGSTLVSWRRKVASLPGAQGPKASQQHVWSNLTLSKGSGKTFDSDECKAWSSQLQFVNPVAGGQKSCWLTIKPLAWGGAWAYGCWLCNRVGMPTAFGRIESRSGVGIRNLHHHAGTKGHIDAERALNPNLLNQELVGKGPARSTVCFDCQFVWAQWHGKV